MLIQRNLATITKRHNLKSRNSSQILSRFDCSKLHPKPDRLFKSHKTNRNHLFLSRKTDMLVQTGQKKQNSFSVNSNTQQQPYINLHSTCSASKSKILFIQSINFTQSIPNSIKNTQRYIELGNILSKTSSVRNLQTQKEILTEETKNIFRIVQQEQQKIKEKQKMKEITPLQTTSKRLLKVLDKQFKYDFKSNQLRKRYISLFHNREKSLKNNYSHKREQSLHSLFYKSQGPNSQNFCNSSLEAKKCKQILNKCSPSLQDAKTNKCMKLFKKFSFKLAQNCQKKKIKLEELKKIY